MDAVNEKLVAWLRTMMPIWWSALVGWAVTQIPVLTPVRGWLDGLGAPLTVLVVGAVVYPVLRWLEARLPDWLSRLLMGSAKQPAYVSASSGAHALDGRPSSAAGDTGLPPVSGSTSGDGVL